MDTSIECVGNPDYINECSYRWKTQTRESKYSDDPLDLLHTCVRGIDHIHKHKCDCDSRIDKLESFSV